MISMSIAPREVLSDTPFMSVLEGNLWSAKEYRLWITLLCLAAGCLDAWRGAWMLLSTPQLCDLGQMI